MNMIRLCITSTSKVIFLSVTIEIKKRWKRAIHILMVVYTSPCLKYAIDSIVNKKDNIEQND
jgi:hypothetical protein